MYKQLREHIHPLAARMVLL